MAFLRRIRRQPGQGARAIIGIDLRKGLDRLLPAYDDRSGDTIHAESSRRYDAESFARLADLGGWRVAEVWTDAERLFAVFGLIAATPAKGA